MANSRPPNGTPSAAEFGLLRAYLARNGFTQQQINQAVGVVPNGRTRAEITDQLTDWLRGNNGQ